MRTEQIAKTILNQITTLTPRAVLWSWGASAFRGVKSGQIDLKHSYEAALLFYVRGRKHKGQVVVSLTPMDTYTLTIGHLRKGAMSIKKQITGIHFEELSGQIDELIEKQDNYTY